MVGGYDSPLVVGEFLWCTQGRELYLAELSPVARVSSFPIWALHKFMQGVRDRGKTGIRG